MTDLQKSGTDGNLENRSHEVKLADLTARDLPRGGYGGAFYTADGRLLWWD